jgi:hypothetical protein
MTDTPGAETGLRRRPPQRRSHAPVGIAVIVLAAVAAGVAAWFLIARDSGSDNTATTPPAGTGAVLMSASGLKALSRASNQPIYWLGQRPGRRLELTRTANGRTFVRYLPANAKVGTDVPYLTVGTYALKGAYAATLTAARKSASTRIPLARAVAFYSASNPSSVYVAFRDSDYQVEVYDPSAREARALVRAGLVKAVGGTSVVGREGAQQVTVAELRNIAASAGHPVYWAGPRAGTKYEATALADGRVYIRYLPRSAPVGTTKAYPTIGTYPVKDAYAVTQGLLKHSDIVRLPDVRGGVALYSSSRPTNVYVAYPGASAQVEVFDPSPARARATAAHLVAIR